MREVFDWRLQTHLYSPADFDAALPKNSSTTRSTDTPGGHVTISPSPAPLAFSCETAHRASNAKCLGELSTTPAFRPRLLRVCLRQTRCLIQRTKRFCRLRPVTRTNRRRRIVQFKMPITNNQIVKEPTGASFTSLSSTHQGKSPKRCALIDRGRTRFALARA